MMFRWIYDEHPELTIFEQIKKNRRIGNELLENNYNLPDPQLMRDLERAVDRIITALTRNERLIIFGHDDLDGITSTYLLFDFLESAGYQNHYYYIPNRMVEDHGIQQRFIDKVLKNKCNLVITVDNGITDYAAVEKLNRKGVDVIITDHHIVPDELPPAHAVVNPKRRDCHFPFDMLAGVGVVYFLIIRLAEKMNIVLDKNYLFWVAVGSIADKVPMIGLNRILVKKALEEWNNFDDETFRLLTQMNFITRNHTSRMGLIRFIIRLLSSNRDESGENKSLELLIRNTSSKDRLYQKLLKDYNRQEDRLEKLKKNLDELLKDQRQPCLVHFDSTGRIPYEFLGFSASYLSNLAKIPVIMLKKKNKVIVCEARSTEGFDLVDSFRHCKQHLIQFGGHKKAAGFTMEPEKLGSFRDCMASYIREKNDEIEGYRNFIVDAVFDTNRIEEYKQFIQTDFDFLQPYGENNPAPIVMLKGFIPAIHEKVLNIENSSLLENRNGTHDLLLKYNGAGIRILDHAEK